MSGLQTQRLSLSGEGGSLAVYHLFGSHVPYDLTAEATRSITPTDAVTATKGCFAIVFEYAAQLRELGVYDNTTIIITGDHGLPREGFEQRDRDMQSPVLTALLIKPAGAEATAAQSNNAPVNHDNLRPYVLKVAGLDYQDFGQEYFAVAEDSDILRDYYWKATATSEHPAYLQIFSVKGDASSWSNWQESRRVDIKYWY